MSADRAAVSSWVVTAGEQSPQTVERLLGLLPAWFGIESSNAHYMDVARTMPTYLAWPAESGGQAPSGEALSGEALSGEALSGEAPSGRAAGVLLAARHFPGAAEVYLLAVDPAVHRQGVGRALIEAFERDLVADGVRLLQVKTLGPSHADEGYRKTRLFYQDLGFEPLEENHELWDHNPCLIMVKVL